MYDALIFDLDGTLWNSAAPVTEAWNRALTKLGQTDRRISEGEIAGIMGMPHHKVFETIFPSHSLDEREAIAVRCYQEEIDILRAQGGLLYPGVDEGLKRLAEHFSLLVVSNCLEDYLETFLESSGFRSLFLDSECHGATRKMKAENIRAVVERNHLKTPAYIGDTEMDQQAARRAGVDYYHVAYGFGRPAGECCTFESFPELVKFFLND